MSIVCEVLHKEDFWPAQTGLLQSGGIGLLFRRQARQDPAWEIRYYLEFLRGLFQRKQEVVDYLKRGGGVLATGFLVQNYSF